MFRKDNYERSLGYGQNSEFADGEGVIVRLCTPRAHHRTKCQASPGWPHLRRKSRLTAVCLRNSAAALVDRPAGLVQSFHSGRRTVWSICDRRFGTLCVRFGASVTHGLAPKGAGVFNRDWVSKSPIKDQK